ncbi:MAG: hypothetical protein MUF73_02810 [Rhodobacteraceae bacterium]|jgi:hypothetical protein|nr:hypothetical protein [Paracoccaceae bacterium]
MNGTATQRPAEDHFGSARVAVGPRVRVAVSRELRLAYRALCRPPAVRPDGPAVPVPQERPAQSQVVASSPDTGHDTRPVSPAGGFCVRLQPLGEVPAAVVQTSFLTSVAGPVGAETGWSLDLFVDAEGRPYARLTVALGPRGRSGRGEMAVALSSPTDLADFLDRAETGGPWSLAVSGQGTSLGLDCLTSDGRLLPRSICRKDKT